MVNPQWGSFQKPNENDFEEESELQEFEQELPGKTQDDEMPEGNKPEWGDFQTVETYQGEPDPQKDESFLSFISRNALSNTLRVVEKIGGSAGDLEKFAKDALVNLPSKGGFLGEAISEWVGKDRWEKIVRGNPEHQMFPTSQNLKQATEAITGDYTKPKGPKEKSFQEGSEDVGSLIGGKLLGRTNPLTRDTILTPAAANAAKEMVEYLGFGDDAANKAKMAVWLPMSLAFNVNAPAYASQMMNNGRNAVPQTVQSNVPRLSSRLDALERSPLMLSADPRSDLARQQIMRIRDDLANGQSSVRSLMTTYDGVNAAKRTRGMFDLGRNDRNFARARINEVNNVLREEIRESTLNNPGAFQQWQNGVTAWSVIHQSNAITNWVEELARGPYAKALTGPTAALFGVGAYGGIKGPLVSGALGATVPAAYKSGQTLYRMWNDPNLARYYWDSIRAAQTQNVPAFINNYEKLDKELNKSQSSKKNTKNNKNK